MVQTLGLINAPEAWELTTGSDEILIGIIDSGIDVTHPDLVGRPNNIPHTVERACSASTDMMNLSPKLETE